MRRGEMVNLGWKRILSFVARFVGLARFARVGVAVLQVREARVLAEHLLVEPAVEHAAPEAPLLAQLHGGDAFFLRPLVDRLRLEAEVVRDLLEREDLVPGGLGHRARVAVLSAGRPSSMAPRNSGCASYGAPRP